MSVAGKRWGRVKDQHRLELVTALAPEHRVASDRSFRVCTALTGLFLSVSGLSGSPMEERIVEPSAR